MSEKQKSAASRLNAHFWCPLKSKGDMRWEIPIKIPIPTFLSTKNVQWKVKIHIVSKL